MKKTIMLMLSLLQKDYLHIQKDLVLRRTNGTLLPMEEDGLLEDLDDIWWKMSNKEQAKVRQITSEAIKNYMDTMKALEKENR